MRDRASQVTAGTPKPYLAISSINAGRKSLPTTEPWVSRRPEVSRCGMALAHPSGAMAIARVQRCDLTWPDGRNSSTRAVGEERVKGERSMGGWTRPTAHLPVVDVRDRQSGTGITSTG